MFSPHFWSLGRSLRPSQSLLLRRLCLSRDDRNLRFRQKWDNALYFPCAPGALRGCLRTWRHWYRRCDVSFLQQTEGFCICDCRRNGNNGFPYRHPIGRNLCSIIDMAMVILYYCYYYRSYDLEYAFRGSGGGW